ncbi:MAG: C25 family cysteine peptidase [Planctomycetota bacterium]|nr:C25 family cysteine peptidase [Planctomycetota bacterium]
MQNIIASSRRRLMRLTTSTFILAACLAAGPGFAQSPSVTGRAAQEGTVSVAVPVGSYHLERSARGREVRIPDFGALLVPGKPVLPSKIFAIAIPPGAKVTGVDYQTGEGVTLPGAYRLPPAELPRVIGQERPAVYARERAAYERNHRTVYGSDDAYPAEVAEFVRTAGYRKYNLVDIRVTPFAYRPQSGRLTYYPDVTVQVNYELPDRPAPMMMDNLRRTERVASEMILNYDEAAGWYGPAAPLGQGLYDLVIITLDSLTASIQPLVDWELSKGRTVQVVTTSWISGNYSGYDLAEKMRNFLREKYPSEEWGIEDVLIIGHWDDVPMRLGWQNVGYGRPETDFYFAELSYPDSQSWDSDGDHRWGEDSDPIDFYAEVNVGRIPWSGTAAVSHICEKSIAYEQNDELEFKKNILLLGAFFWPDTDNAVLMERKVDESWMVDWTMTRMYEDGYSNYPMDYNLRWTNVKNVWSGGKYAFVNWAGHGSPWSSHIYYSTGEGFVDTNTCGYLNDDYPAIIFADACSNSDTDEANIGRAMLQHGGVGFVGATKVAFGMPGWSGPNSGSSQSLDYFFTTAVTSGEMTQGEALQVAMREMYTNGLWYYTKYETFEWGALFGNPSLALQVPQNCPGNFDGDDDVDTADLLILLGAWGTAGPDGDVDEDGDVDTEDLLALLAAWGDCPRPPCPWDFNGDSVVDEADRDILLDHWGDCPDPPDECPWDLTEDGVVDGLDLVELEDHYGSCP